MDYGEKVGRRFSGQVESRYQIRLWVGRWVAALVGQEQALADPSPVLEQPVPVSGCSDLCNWPTLRRHK